MKFSQECPFCKETRFNNNKLLNELLGNPIECDILPSSYKFKNEFSYIYTESPQDRNIIYKVGKLPSQFLRKLIAEKLSNANYLWQETCITSDSMTNLKQTILDLQNKIVI